SSAPSCPFCALPTGRSRSPAYGSSRCRLCRPDRFSRCPSCGASLRSQRLYRRFLSTWPCASAQREDDQDDQKQGEPTARVITPPPAVGPQRQTAENDQDQEYEENCP